MYKYLKRIKDFVIAFVALVVLFVPLLVVAILMGAIQDMEVPLVGKQVLPKDGVECVRFQFVCEKKGSH